MNRRINKIILDMLRGKKHTLQKYAEQFEVSEQTIRNDLNEVNQLFIGNGQDQLTLDDHGGIIFNYEQDWTKLLKAYASFRHYRLSQNERRTILALLLMTSTDFVTTYYLSEYVLVSRNTLLSDIEELKIWFRKNCLELYSQVGKGYQIRGDEAKIRNGMLKLILLNGLIASKDDYSFGSENNIFRNLLLTIIDKDANYQTIGELLIEAEQKNNIQLSDFSYQEVICYLLIAIERVKKGQTFYKIDKELLLASSSKYEFAKAMIAKISQIFNISFSETEVLHFTFFLRQKSYLKNNGRKIDSIETQILVNEFILNLSNKLSIKYYLNHELFELLENHLKLSILRIKENIQVQNEMLAEITESYQDVFPLVRSSLTNLEAYLQKKFSDDEVSFIVMYAMAIVENSTSDQPIIRVQLVCNSGRGTAQLLKAKIKTLFPQIDIVSVASSHTLSIDQPFQQDIIISTVPLNALSDRLVIVNPILTEANIMEIQRAIYQVKVEKNSVPQKTVKGRQDSFYREYLKIIDKYIDTEEKAQALEELQKVYFSHFGTHNEKNKNREIAKLSDILPIQRVVLDAQARDWQTAVRLAGNLLLQDDLILERYIQAMITIVDELDSYVVIYPGVAIPHANQTDGALATGASLVRLATPVKFNHKKNDPVKYVIAFSLADKDNLGACLYNLTEILAKGLFEKRLDKCRTEWELLEMLQRLENEVMGLNNEKITI